MNAKYPQSFGELEPHGQLTRKISAFSAAMEKYNKSKIYKRIEWLTSLMVILLQAYTLFHLIMTYDGTPVLNLMIALIIAYILTDFINGWVHMYMDNNTAYHSIVGPFISSFHLHHSTLKYRQRHPLHIYFYESGTKFWLLGYLILLTCSSMLFVLSYEVTVVLSMIGILSSIAELSHYWCHNATKENTVIMRLQKLGILLSKQHHMHHHRKDNTHYAFLNGISDPLLNLIAKHLYQGYKNHADKHTVAYIRAS